MANEEATVRENALSPKMARTDMGTMEQHSIPDQIAGVMFERSQTSIKTASRGILQTKLSPPGTV